MSDLLLAHFLGDMERDAVLAVADGPLSAKAISIRMGHGDDVPTKLKIILSGLVDRGVLLNARDGYAVGNPLFITVARRLHSATRGGTTPG